MKVFGIVAAVAIGVAFTPVATHAVIGQSDFVFGGGIDAGDHFKTTWLNLDSRPCHETC